MYVMKRTPESGSHLILHDLAGTMTSSHLTLLQRTTDYSWCHKKNKSQKNSPKRRGIMVIKDSVPSAPDSPRYVISIPTTMSYMPDAILPPERNREANSTHRLSRLDVQRASTDIKRFVEARLEKDFNLVKASRHLCRAIYFKFYIVLSGQSLAIVNSNILSIRYYLSSSHSTQLHKLSPPTPALTTTSMGPRAKRPCTLQFPIERSRVASRSTRTR